MPLATNVLGLQPFVPRGKNFRLACQFFQDLGFQKSWDAEGLAGFSCGNAKFILQEYDQPDFANNLMIRLDVADLDDWWQSVEKLGLEQKYPGVKLKAPQVFPWGREVNIIDPAGVCWHIG
jgi:hypothetical protein